MLEWKKISAPGCDAYEVSDDGSVRNSKKEILKPCIDKKGYASVSLGSIRARKTFKIHRLVAIAFVPGDHSLHVDHIDGKRSRNAASNLRWVTCAENNAISRISGRWNPSIHTRGNRQLTDAQVLEIRSVRDHSGKTCARFAEQFGVTRETVRFAAVGKTFRHLPFEDRPALRRGRPKGSSGSRRPDYLLSPAEAEARWGSGDMVKRPIGPSRSNDGTITNRQVEYIRAHRDRSADFCRRLANELGVTPQTIRDVAIGRTHRNLPFERPRPFDRWRKQKGSDAWPHKN